MKSIPSVRPGPWSIVPFFFGWGFLFALVRIMFEAFTTFFDVGTSGWVFIGFFLVGASVGIFLNRWWKKSEGKSFESFFVLSLLLFSVFLALLGAFVMMALGDGQETLALIGGMLGSALGARLGYFLLGGNLGARRMWGWAAIIVGLLLEVFLEQFESISPIFAPFILMMPAFGLLLVHYWGRSRK